MTFHPNDNLPGCMMPDGGDCCEGHAAVVDDWHKQRRHIETLKAALRCADQFITNGIELGYIRMPDADTPDSAHKTPGIIRAALAPEQDK
jgi:hypothetical protein